MHAEVADVKLQESCRFSNLEFIINRFPVLVTNTSLDKVAEQVCLYQSTDVSGCIKDRIGFLLLK